MKVRDSEWSGAETLTSALTWPSGGQIEQLENKVDALEKIVEALADMLSAEDKAKLLGLVKYYGELA